VLKFLCNSGSRQRPQRSATDPGNFQSDAEHRARTRYHHALAFRRRDNRSRHGRQSIEPARFDRPQQSSGPDDAPRTKPTGRRNAGDATDHRAGTV